jgi:hypothetical protein
MGPSSKVRMKIVPRATPPKKKEGIKLGFDHLNWSLERSFISPLVLDLPFLTPIGLHFWLIFFSSLD